MRNPRLESFTLDELLEEISSRFKSLLMPHPDLMQPQSVQLLPPMTNTEPQFVLPKGVTKVEEIPGRFNRDGAPKKLLTMGIPQEVRDRLTVKGDEPEDSSPDRPMQFILKGEDREAMARNFIDQWQSEIEDLEFRLQGLIPDTERYQEIQNSIRDLRWQIARRSDSAFGGMSSAQARAQNLADNGNISDAPSEPGVAGRGNRFVMQSLIPEWDTPGVTYLDCKYDAAMVKALDQALKNDPICGHVPDRFSFTHGEGLESIRLVAEPSVVYRLAAHLERYALLQKKAPKDFELYHHLKNVTYGHAVDFMGNAEVYRRCWTELLRNRYHAIRAGAGDALGMSLKRAIRILNPDFQEREAPDSFFESTDGENPLGVQRRPHVDPKGAWSSVEESAGVFKMTRQAPVAGDTDSDLGDY